jgi:hypothetical protein
MSDKSFMTRFHFLTEHISIDDAAYRFTQTSRQLYCTMVSPILWHRFAPLARHQLREVSERNLVTFRIELI